MVRVPFPTTAPKEPATNRLAFDRIGFVDIETVELGMKD